MDLNSAIFSILPQSHYLLASKQFNELDNWLQLELAKLAEHSFKRYRPLQNLASSGRAFLNEMQEWHHTSGQSPYAQAILGATYSSLASEFRGSATDIREIDGIHASLCADLAARYFIQHMVQHGPTIFVCCELFSLMNHVGAPVWFYHPEVQFNDTLKQNIKEQLPALDDVVVPTIPDWSACDWLQNNNLDEEILLKLACQLAKDDYYIYSGWQHYLRPRWGGSEEQMLELAEGQLTQTLTADQRAVLKITALADHISDMESEELDDEAVDHAIATLDALSAHTVGPFSKAYLLCQRGFFLFNSDDMEAVADCFLAAVNTSDFALAELVDDVDQLFIVYPHEAATGKLAKAAFLEHSIRGAAILSLCYHFGLGGLPQQPDIANAIADYVASYRYGIEEWAFTANDLSVRHPVYAQHLLQQGIARSFAGAHAELADMFLCGVEVPEDIERAREIAKAGAALGHVDALAVQYTIEADEDDLEDEQRIAVLKKMADIGLAGNKDINEDILQKAVSRMDEHPECDALAYQLTQQAYQRNCAWAAGHLAFHLYFGRGTAKNKSQALVLTEEALDEDDNDSAALRVNRAQRFPFMYRILRPKKTTLYDLWQLKRRLKDGVDES